MNRASEVFLSNLREELQGRGQKEAAGLLSSIIDHAKADSRYAADLAAWARVDDRSERPVTTGLRDLCKPFGSYWKDLDFANTVDAVDAASIPACDNILTKRTVEDRLFPSREWDTGWSISIQADRAGYACHPKEHLANLEDYENVEVVVYGPEGLLVDPRTLDLPDSVSGKFTDPEAHCPSIGCHLTWSDVDLVVESLNRAGMNPNAGVPRGDIGWSGADLWHGTDEESAADIAEHGIRMEASGRGYFGPAFYAADKRDLAVSNYANAFDDEPGSLVRISFCDDAHVLDLRNSEDAREWAPWGDRVSDPGFDRLMRKAGIDAVYDRSMGGFAIYRVNAVTVDGLESLEPDSDRPGF